MCRRVFFSSFSRSTRFPRLLGNRQQSQDNRPYCGAFGPSEKAIPTWRVPFGIPYIALGVGCIIFAKRDTFVNVCALCCAILGGMFILKGYVNGRPDQQDYGREVLEPTSFLDHGEEIVPRKYFKLGHYRF
jgi:hypothetical protein